MATRLPKTKAKAEIAAVEAHLRAGAPAIAVPGRHTPLAVTLAARDLGVDLSGLRRRVGSPAVKGSHERDHRLKVDWTLAPALAPADEIAAAEAGEFGTDPVMPGFAISQVVNRLDAEGGSLGTTVTQRRARGEAAPIPAGHVVKGLSTFYDGQGRKIAEWVKTARETEAASALDAIRETFAAYRGAAPLLAPPPIADDERLTVYPIPDVHLGMYSYQRETGENYDVDIATARLRAMASDLVAQSSPSRTAIILGLGDFFHANDHKAMTPRSGHILDVDGRWPRTVKAGVRLAMDLIELAAQKHERVIVRFLPGNHDPDATAGLTAALSIFYDANPRVTVDDDPSLVFYHRFGRVLLGASHGHTMKPDRMAMMLATDRAEDWGATHFRHFFFGHIHTDTAKEVGPVKVESFNTPASKDAHAHGGGYRSGQALNALTFHRDRGEIGRHRVNLLPAFARQV